MKAIKSGCAAFLLAISSLQANAGEITAADTKEPDPGYISIYADNEFICKLRIEEGKTDLFEEEKDCKVKPFSSGSFQLENVRSAATIIMSANYGAPPDGSTPVGCYNTLGFRYEVKTVKNNITTHRITLNDLRTNDPKIPIVPGLLFKSKFIGSGTDPQIRCLTINFD